MATVFIYEGIEYTGHMLQSNTEKVYENTLVYRLIGNGFEMVVEYIFKQHTMPSPRNQLILDFINKTTNITNYALHLNAEIKVTIKDGTVYDTTNLISDEHTVILSRPFTHLESTPTTLTMQQFDRLVSVSNKNDRVEYVFGNTGVDLQVGLQYKTKIVIVEKSTKVLVQITANLINNYLEKYSSFVSNFEYIHNEFISQNQSQKRVMITKYRKN